jgi:hypothetical protein
VVLNPPTLYFVPLAFASLSAAVFLFASAIFTFSSATATAILAFTSSWVYRFSMVAGVAMMVGLTVEVGVVFLLLLLLLVLVLVLVLLLLLLLGVLLATTLFRRSVQLDAGRTLSTITTVNSSGW